MFPQRDIEPLYNVFCKTGFAILELQQREFGINLIANIYGTYARSSGRLKAELRALRLLKKNAQLSDLLQSLRQVADDQFRRF